MQERSVSASDQLLVTNHMCLSCLKRIVTKARNPVLALEAKQAIPIISGNPHTNRVRGLDESQKP